MLRGLSVRNTSTSSQQCTAKSSSGSLLAFSGDNMPATPPSRARKPEKTRLEHRNDHPKIAAILCGGRGASNQGAITQWDYVRDDDRYRGPKTVRTKTWHRCLVDATTWCIKPERSPRNTPRWCLELRPRTRQLSAKKANKWYRGVLEAADGSMV